MVHQSKSRRFLTQWKNKVFRKSWIQTGTKYLVMDVITEPCMYVNDAWETTFMKPPPQAHIRWLPFYAGYVQAGVLPCPIDWPASWLPQLVEVWSCTGSGRKTYCVASESRGVICLPGQVVEIDVLPGFDTKQPTVNRILRMTRHSTTQIPMRTRWWNCHTPVYGR